jgi:hypothetical protein
MPQRVDDPTIADSEILWRRILPNWLHHDADGTIRPSKVAFTDRHTGEVSVHLASIMLDHNLALEGRPDDSLAAIFAGHPRSLGFAIVRDPKPDDPSHTLICPSPTESKARQIAKQATWVVLRTHASS